MERENNTKKRIRQTALELFNEKSFEGVTLNEICEKSGVNKHTFYYYFKSKDELLNHYYEIPNEIKTTDLSTILEAESYVEQFWLLVKNPVDFIEKSGVTIARQIIIKNVSENVGTFDMAEEKREILKIQVATIRKGQASGEFRNPADPKFLANLFHQMLIADAFMWCVRNGDYSFRDSLRYMYEMSFDVAPQYRIMQDYKYPSHIKET